MKRGIIMLACLILPNFVHATSFMPISVRYQTGGPVRILIVPGHDNDFSGAVYRGIREEDMNVQMANQLAETLRTDTRFQVTVSRTIDGSYISELTSYFETEESEVNRFIRNAKRSFKRFLNDGDIDIVDNNVPHGDAPELAAYRLYAMNKWIDESGYDLVLHVHFNDYGSRPYEAPGSETGYSVYVPDDILPNSEPAATIGNAIANRLQKVWKPATGKNPTEKLLPNGMIKDYKLIALGSYRTLQTPSMLIEYSFIYEPHVHSELLPATAKTMAHSILIAMREYFSQMTLVPHNVSYDWKTNMSRIVEKQKTPAKPNADVLMLQYALAELQFYPPAGKTRDDCQFTGIFGECTELAVKAFQKEYNLGSDGKVGPKTRIQLNTLF